MTKSIFAMKAVFAERANQLLLLALILITGAAVAQQPQAVAPAAPQSVAPDYRLNVGDNIRIAVFQNPDLTVDTRVAESGIVTYPLIGTVKIGGLTVPDAEQAIANRLRDGGFVRKPQVSIFVQVRGNQVSILGMVNKPGRYPIETTTMRASEVLSMAGGPLQMAGANAAADIAILSGIREGRPYRAEIDIPAIFLENRSDSDVVVAPGDTIYVHRAPVYYIYGEVQKPGAYRVERNMTVLQAMAQGGGLTPRGTERGLRLHRTGPDGKVQVISPEKDSPIRENDILYVKESFF